MSTFRRRGNSCSSRKPASETAVRPMFKRLKQEGIFVRYMNYDGWGDGLRISVGTNEQIDRLLERLKAMV